ncbi:MAG: DNA polymerase III subunit [Polyangiaceae bacterium]
MTLREVLGQEGAIGRIETALASGRLHHAYRFEGPEGVGKAMTAFGLAQALLCTAGDPLGCGKCRACEHAVTLRDGVPLHPDVVLIERGLYSAEQLGGKDSKTVISIDQIRTVVIGQVAFAPYEGRARVFIVLGADELSTQAANTLLKTLEEPPPRTHFILVTYRPSKLLPTIRSRSVPIRFAPLDDTVLTRILEARGVEAPRIKEILAEAEGSASEAVRLVDPEAWTGRRAFIDRALDALRTPSLAESVLLAESGEKSRELLREQIEGLARYFARAGRREAMTGSAARAERLANAHERVMDAWRNLDGGQNANTTLTVIELLSSLRRARR